jgi:ribosome-associated protein
VQAKRDNRRSESELSELADRLVRVGKRQLDRLRLPEPVLEALSGARTIKSHIARERAWRLLRKELRDVDAEAIGARLDELEDTGTRAAALDHWCARLEGEGDQALTELSSAFPETDRQKLRSLLRNLSRAQEPERPAAERALRRALRELMSRSEPAADE